MIGDAYGFVDPMFSTGVLMAMTAGELGAEAAHAWLDNPARGERAGQADNRELARAMDRIGWLIYRINDPVCGRCSWRRATRSGCGTASSTCWRATCAGTGGRPCRSCRSRRCSTSVSPAPRGPRARDARGASQRYLSDVAAALRRTAARYRGSAHGSPATMSRRS